MPRFEVLTRLDVHFTNTLCMVMIYEMTLWNSVLYYILSWSKLVGLV